MIKISSGICKDNIKEVVCRIDGVVFVKQDKVNQYFVTPNDDIYEQKVKEALQKDRVTKILFYAVTIQE